MATTIPTKATGNVLSAGDWNTLTPLNSGVGLYGYSGQLYGGTPPGTSSPGFLIQVGTITVTVSSANFTATLPVAFPNGILAVTANVSAVGGNFWGVTDLTATGASAFKGQIFEVTSSGLTVPSGSVEISFIAIGY